MPKFTTIKQPKLLVQLVKESVFIRLVVVALNDYAPLEKIDTNDLLDYAEYHCYELPEVLTTSMDIYNDYDDFCLK